MLSYVEIFLILIKNLSILSPNNSASKMWDSGMQSTHAVILCATGCTLPSLIEPTKFFDKYSLFYNNSSYISVPEASIRFRSPMWTGKGIVKVRLRLHHSIVKVPGIVIVKSGVKSQKHKSKVFLGLSWHCMDNYTIELDTF